MWGKVALVAVLGCAALAGGAIMSVPGLPPPSVAAQPGVDPGAPPPKRLFISGHSLTDRPFPELLASVVTGAGLPFTWDRQYREGSSIRERLDGAAKPGVLDRPPRGIDRDDRPIDIATTFRGGHDFDALLITERNALIGEVLWSEAPRALRAYRDLFASEGTGRPVYFYVPWITVTKDDPERWIAFERAAAPVWQCFVARVDASLRQSPGGRLVAVPVALALSELVSRALADPGLPGVSQGTRSATLDALFRDEVHPTPMTAYYNALVTYAQLWNRSPVGAWAPADLAPETVRSLQTVAAEASRLRPPSLSPAECASFVRRSFQWTFWSYLAAVKPGDGTFKRFIATANGLRNSIPFLLQDRLPNPFTPAAPDESDYWSR